MVVGVTTKSWCHCNITIQHGISTLLHGTIILTPKLSGKLSTINALWYITTIAVPHDTRTFYHC